MNHHTNINLTPQPVSQRSDSGRLRVGREPLQAKRASCALRLAVLASKTQRQIKIVA